MLCVSLPSSTSCGAQHGYLEGRDITLPASVSPSLLSLARGGCVSVFLSTYLCGCVGLLLWPQCLSLPTSFSSVNKLFIHLPVFPAVTLQSDHCIALRASLTLPLKFSLSFSCPPSVTDYPSSGSVFARVPHGDVFPQCTNKLNKYSLSACHVPDSVSCVGEVKGWRQPQEP